MSKSAKNRAGAADKPVSLKMLAQHVKLSPTTVSAILNDSVPARTIPKETKDRVFQAARELNYRPNFLARSLRQKRTFTVAVIVQEISEGYASNLLEGIEARLLQEQYLYFIASQRGQDRLMEDYLRLLIDRAVEGFILVNTQLKHELPIPTVCISGPSGIKGVTRISLDNRKGSWLALEHLANLGHRNVAFFQGHPGSVDTASRWEGICLAAKACRIPIRSELTVQLKGMSGGPEPSTPEEGYFYAQKLLERKQPFTALVAFNDVSALGAISAFRDAGLRVPQDISVVGFDDIKAAAFQNPRLTTIRQPLHAMGELAAMTLLQRIANPAVASADVLVEPTLVVRESTCAPAVNGWELRAESHAKTLSRR